MRIHDLSRFQQCYLKNNFDMYDRNVVVDSVSSWGQWTQGANIVALSGK